MSAMEGQFVSPPESPHMPKSSVHIEMDCPLTLVEERTSRSRSSSPRKNMSSFQSARERSERLGSRPANAGYTNGQANNWRDESPGTAGHPQYPYYQPQYDPHAPMMGGQYPAHRPRGNSVMMGENSVPLSTIVPGAVWPTEAQLTASYGYGIRREDGSVSRLYPADELPAPHNVPPRQGPEGLIIVPPPRQVSPNRRMGTEIMIPGDIVQQLSMGRPHYQEQGYPYDNTQMHIDSIVAHAGSSTSVSPPQRRREKIYCDKWIHEGVCAFTQLGCKYKHEMPMDKATQMTLGLNHGLPSWYRRAYAVNLNHEPTSPGSVSSPPRHVRTEGSWRSRAQPRLEAPPSGNLPATGGSQYGTGGPRSFGPIAPPANSHTSPSNNPYSSLKIEEQEGEDEDEEEDTVTWQGRRS